MPKGFARKLTRCLRLVYLTTYGRYTSEELASKLAVSRRTIFRDLNCLRDAGYQVDLGPEQKYILRAPCGGGSRGLDAQGLSTILLCARTSILAQNRAISTVVESVAERLVEGVRPEDQTAIEEFFGTFHIYGKFPSLSYELLQVFVQLVIGRLQGATIFRIRYRGSSGGLIETELLPMYFNVGENGCSVGGTSSFHHDVHLIDVAQVVDIEPLRLSVAPPHVSTPSDVPG